MRLIALSLLLATTVDASTRHALLERRSARLWQALDASLVESDAEQPIEQLLPQIDVDEQPQTEQLPLQISLIESPTTDQLDTQQPSADPPNQSTSQRAEAVREAFLHAWNGYRQYGFPADEVKPVTRLPANSRNGWSCSAVEALGTAILMEEHAVVDDILTHIPQIDFTQTSTEVSLFETTIRYLGGLLSAYDLLRGPYQHLVAPQDPRVAALLRQSQTIADTLKFAFNTPSGIPHNDLNMTLHEAKDDGDNCLAGAGTLVLEWTRLSDLTGNPEYAQLAQRAQAQLMRPRTTDEEPFPGLLGRIVRLDDGQITVNTGGWGAQSDSYYEYLLKTYLYDPTRFAAYRDQWTLAANSTMKYLTTFLPSNSSVMVLPSFAGTSKTDDMEHFTCFAGGNFLLAGEALNEPRYTNYGLKIIDGCRHVYASTPTHIGPDQWSWLANGVSASAGDYYQKAGVWPIRSEFILRPEVIESYYHAWRITGKQQYRDWVWDAFVAVNATARVAAGFSTMSDVLDRNGGVALDVQESFLFAELLKYCWLTFAESPVQVGGSNEWIFSTEAHPIHAARFESGSHPGNAAIVTQMPVDQQVLGDSRSGYGALGASTGKEGMNSDKGREYVTAGTTIVRRQDRQSRKDWH